MSFEAFEKAWESQSPPAHKPVLLAVANQADEYGCAVVNLDNLAAAGEVSVEGQHDESLLVRVYPKHTFRPGQSPLRRLFEGGEA